MSKIAIIIPTYRRTQELANCLKSINKQIRLPDRVILVVRDTDRETISFLDTFNSSLFSLNIVKVTVPGVVAAMNLGLELATEDIVCFTDDDATPHPNWLMLIEQHFASDSCLGGLGGKDSIYINNQLQQGKYKSIGKLSWFGRVTGNHHLGIGQPIEVDVLKGVNMSFRKIAIKNLRFDENMKGTGAQVHFELAFCLALKQAGWKLIYDPEVKVNHYPARRFDEDIRRSFNKVAWSNAVHNETFALLKYLSPNRRLIFLFWSILVGTRRAFGIIQLLRFLPNERLLARQKFSTSMYGRWHGWKTWKKMDTQNLKVTNAYNV